MTRAIKIGKLANAVREYRGAKSATTGKWRRLPNIGAKARVEKWLLELKLDVGKSMAAIDGFPTRDAFCVWLRGLG